MHSNRGLSRRNCLETMSCSWGTELWDQFDNLEKHTQWGIEFLERYTKFVKERSEIELSYAKQIRNLSKKYQLKKNSKDEEEYKYTSCRAFLITLNELNDYAGQHEVIAENLSSQITAELTRYTQELKAERKSHFHDGRRAQQHIENSWKQLESSKRRFERDCKEADRAQHYFDKVDADINVTKADVEKRCSLKAKQQAQLRHQVAEDSKNEYLTYLQKFNKDQHEHYYTLIPHIFQRIQEMEERRVGRVRESMRVYTEVERKVLPIVSKCLDGMTKAAESIEPKMDSKQVVESYKSGFEPPGDVEFEDYSVSMKRAVSESSFLNARGESRRRSRSKLWPLLKRNKLMSLLASPRQPPPPPPTSPSPDGLLNGPQSPQQPKEPLSQRLNDFMSTKHKMHCLRSLKRGLSLKLGTGQEDYSHLPPEQRRKKLQAKLNDINKDIQKEMDQRDALTKMKDVYIKNPHLGDPDSIDPRLEEITQSLEKLQLEAHKFEGWLTEVERKLLEKGSESQRRQSNHFDSQGNTPLTNNYGQNRERSSAHSPDGSYTEDPSTETTMQFKSRSTEFDDEFDDEEPLPTIGTCKALYPFEGQNEGTISMAEGEMLYVIEEDKGDGWTRVRRNEDEEGYVPTSYIKLFLDTNAKGAMTYI
ncbi:formin-binding protein 1a isoform X1 [Rhinichthys klamathensis goyatoka]|uniref:formin-binding protein 1a isoform X1 n=1 Tax=Pimephales promelas TaxID=90988 RepID=UPI001955F39F|nr:formin-binding protein 1a isoform X1 [Pimephales promelas]XP_056115707.1 formin-binding protein 1a isoform X1 [Rhinichthys klamathensis goyatoka]